MDSVEVECPIDDCVYISKDTLYCIPGTDDYHYQVTICNSPYNAFAIEYIQLNNLLPGRCHLDTTVYQSERNTIGTGQLSDLQLPAFRIGTSQPGFLFWSHRSC